MYLCACWIVVACYRSCICLLIESLLPLIGHVFVCLLNRCGLWTVMYLGHDSTNRQIHDQSQATTIQQAHKHMTDQRHQRFNKHTNTWHRCCLWLVMYLSVSGIVACDRSCICVLVESLLPVIGHVFVCFLNLCDLLSVMYFSANGIVVACDRSCICVLFESLWPT
jgi:hypothetical protein